MNTYDDHHDFTDNVAVPNVALREVHAFEIGAEVRGKMKRYPLYNEHNFKVCNV